MMVTLFPSNGRAERVEQDIMERNVAREATIGTISCLGDRSRSSGLDLVHRTASRPNQLNRAWENDVDSCSLSWLQTGPLDRVAAPCIDLRSRRQLKEVVGCDATRHAALVGTTPSSVEAEPKSPSAKVKRPWPTGQFMLLGGGEAIPGQVRMRDCTGFVRCQSWLVAALRMDTASGNSVYLTWCVCSERSNCSTVCRPRRFLGPQSRSDSSDSTTRHLDPRSMLETPLTSDTQDSSVLWMHHVLSRHRGF